MPRQARLDALGVLQHVIARGIEQRDIFSDRDDYQFFVDRLDRLLNDTGMDCYAWVLMPNHFHLLLRTGPIPLSTFMRRLLTAYSVHYNRRHERAGHLFQNRYKSIICEEDPYFCELVRYIHLNPIRGGIARDLLDLEKYPWSGHRTLMGKDKASWQSCDEVLNYFDRTMARARLRYRRFLQDGLQKGRKPDFSGDRLTSSKVENQKDQQRTSGKDGLRDRRILGDVEFAQNILSRHQRVPETKIFRVSWDDLLRKTSELFDLSAKELSSGSKRKSIAYARCVLSYVAVRNLGMKTTEVAKLLNVSQPAVSKCLLRGEEITKKDDRQLNQLLKEVIIS
jgi:putative transposase